MIEGNNLKTYKITETVEKYHTITLEDDMDIEKIIDGARAILNRCEDGLEAIDLTIEPDFRLYGGEYSIHKCAYGQQTTYLEAEEV